MIDFIKEARVLFPYTQSMRRDFHIHPELGFHEIRTGGIVAKELEALGLEVTKGVGKPAWLDYLKAQRPDLQFFSASTWMHYPLSKRPAPNIHHKIKV